MEPGSSLSANVYEAAEGLGAVIGQFREIPKSVKRCPESIAEFYKCISWPSSASYRASVDQVEMDSIRFGQLQLLPKSIQIPDSEGADFFAIGSHSGDAWILVLDGNDCGSHDPIVYEIDHECPTEEPAGELGRLSAFLQRCVRE